MVYFGKKREMSILILYGDKIRKLWKGGQQKYMVGVLLVFSFVLTFLLYWWGVNQGYDYPSFLKRIVLVFGLFFVSTIIYVITTCVIFLYPNFRLIERLCFIVMDVLLLVVIFFINQKEPTPERGPKFGYGMFYSRGWVLVVFTLLFVSSVFICGIRGGKKCRRIFIFFVMASLLGVAFGFMMLYGNRKENFSRGVYGSFDISASDCHVDNDVFVFNSLVPKYFFHLILFTYWCYEPKSEQFVRILDEESTEITTTTTTLEIDCSGFRGADFVEIDLSPRLHTLTFDQMKWDEDLIPQGKSHLHHNLHERRVTQRVEFPREKKTVTYSYDGEEYETAVVKCGDSRKDHQNIILAKNLIANPRKRTVGDLSDPSNILDLSVDSPNLVTFLFDSVGRKSLEYQLSNTFEYLKKLSKKNDYDVFELYNLHLARPFTIHATLPAYTGFDGFFDKEMPDSIPLWHIENKVKPSMNRKRHVTAFIDNECDEWSSWVGKHRNFLADYVHVEPFCQEEYVSLDKRFELLKGPYSAARKCLFQYEAPEINLNYIKKLFKLYPKKSKYVTVQFQDGHEPTDQGLLYADHFILDFLKYFEKEGHLKNTIFFFWCDHGLGFSYMTDFLKLREGTVEMYAPGTHIIVPSQYLDNLDRKDPVLVDGRKTKRRDVIKINQQRLISFYDFNKVWKSILDIEEELYEKDQRNQFGIDFFNQIVPRDRTPVEAGIQTPEVLVGDCRLEEVNKTTVLGQRAAHAQRKKDEKKENE